MSVLNRDTMFELYQYRPIRPGEFAAFYCHPTLRCLQGWVQNSEHTQGGGGGMADGDGSEYLA